MNKLYHNNWQYPICFNRQPATKSDIPFLYNLLCCHLSLCPFQQALTNALRPLIHPPHSDIRFCQASMISFTCSFMTQPACTMAFCTFFWYDCIFLTFKVLLGWITWTTRHFSPCPITLPFYNFSLIINSFKKNVSVAWKICIPNLHLHYIYNSEIYQILIFYVLSMLDPNRS